MRYGVRYEPLRNAAGTSARHDITRGTPVGRGVGFVVMRTHPLQRRLLCEDLVRLRLPEEGRRYAASQRRGRIDPNPHQIDAVVFALRRIPEGGCILADEVGLGKTIEAGLVLSQLLAEGVRRILVIVPKALVGQWKAELFDLFGIDAREVLVDPDTLRGEGVFLAHRDLAGGERGAPLLWATDPFELVVIDEAHEVFAGLYKRFGRDGAYDNQSRQAQTAHRVRELVTRHRASVLLLTATPIQNALTELWGLVQFVEPTQSLLGRLPTFREIFCDGNDRVLAPGQGGELRRRLGGIMHRTLRRQAEAFLTVPFVRRRARLVRYAMSDAQRALYLDVTKWLLDPEHLAFSGHNGRLVLLGFLRRMSSSLPAFAVSLDRVAARLRETLGLGDAALAPVVTELARDREDEAEAGPEPAPEAAEPASAPPDAPARPSARLAEELRAVEAFAARARAISDDAKARCLVEVVRQVGERAARGEGTGKLVVFTESLTTQDHLRALLVGAGVPDGDITVFRGHNDGPRAQEALAVWEREVASRFTGTPPGRDVALRLALVHEFRTRSRVFLSTEAGAKGLNLQFCETLVNYDLPWNPQRIEQRIGRVHRYGQTRDVTVVNFLAEGNEADKLLFEILSRKLELFGTVLGESDVVLHEASATSPELLVSAVGFDLEAQVARIYGTARSVAEVEDRIRAIGQTFEERRGEVEDEQARVTDLIETRLDDTVQQVFRRYQASLARELADLDRDLDRVLRGYLAAADVPHTRTEGEGVVRYRIGPSARLPAGYADGAVVRAGGSDAEEGEILHLGHPLVAAAVREAREACGALRRVRFSAPEGDWPEALRPLVGRRGRLVWTRVAYRGLEPVDHLLAVAVLEGDEEPLAEPALQALLRLDIGDLGEAAPLDIEERALADAAEARVLADQAVAGEAEQQRFERMLGQLDRYLADQALVLERRRESTREQAEKLERRLAAEVGLAARAQRQSELEQARKELARLDARIDALLAGEDDHYRAWVARLHERRYEPPRIERLLEVDFRIGGRGES
jgi:hypothetical protein